MNTPVFPYPYSIRTSTRAKRASLKVHPQKGLEVIIPTNFPVRHVPDILASHLGWVEKHMARLSYEGAGCSRQTGIPSCFFIHGGSVLVQVLTADEELSECEVPFPSLPQIQQLAKEQLPLSAAKRVLTTGGCVAFSLKTVSIPKHSTKDANERLFFKHWVKQQAYSFLAQRLTCCAQQYGFTFTSFSVRFQKSRWGSCSSKKSISLNAGLLFLPLELADYIVLHELCHTKVMNHSAQFWKKMFAADPLAHKRDREMRSGWKYIPEWLQ